MFEQVDFKSGEIRYCADNLNEEDILLVRYAQNVDLEFGWYAQANCFVLQIIKDNEWSVPVVRYKIYGKEQIELALEAAVSRIENEFSREKTYYGGLWTTEEITVR